MLPDQRLERRGVVRIGAALHGQPGQAAIQHARVAEAVADLAARPRAPTLLLPLPPGPSTLTTMPGLLLFGVCFRHELLELAAFRGR